MSSFTQFAVLCLLLLLLSPTHFNSHHFKLAHANGLCSPSPSGGNGTGLVAEENGMKLYPLVGEKKKMMVMMMMNETRRKLNSFQLCAPCSCCAKGVCLPAPCCYAIKCNIPGKPFGFCAFTPKACHCIGCHL